MNHHPDSLLHYRDEDRELRSVEDLSQYAQVSRAFLRLCLSLGCPTCSGKLSQAMLLDWLFQHYELLRERAGMKPMASIEGVTGEAEMKLKMGNSMITLLEFSESRSSDRGEQRQLRRVRQMMERILERR